MNDENKKTLGEYEEWPAFLEMNFKTNEKEFYELKKFIEYNYEYIKHIHSEEIINYILISDFYEFKENIKDLERNIIVKYLIM